ncbi:MAG: penicillin-binding protein 2 [Acidimicrobiales bacterium]|nr:penicillin-binding protein 2 [Acidimicrobiales bacterium]
MQNSRTRLGILGVVALGLFAAMFTRLWYLQVLSEKEFEVQAETNRTREVHLSAPRGRILDVNGLVLVENRPSIVVTVDKGYFFDQTNGDGRDEIYLRLARQMSRSGRLTKVAEIRESVEDPKYGPFDQVPVVADVTEAFQIWLAERNTEFPGFSTEITTVRHYPYGTVAAHLLGYVGPITAEELTAFANKPKTYHPNDEVGKAGVERFFEDELRGTPGVRKVEVDAAGDLIGILSETDPVAGHDIQLTLDLRVQIAAEQALVQGLEQARLQIPKNPGFDPEYRAPAGGITILDPNNGAVIAMASYPTYDPSEFVGGISQERFDELIDPANFSPFNNRATAGNYAPGSTFKPFTAYAALDTGLIGPRGMVSVDQTINDTGTYVVPGCSGEACEFSNAGKTPYGAVDLRTALTVSSDVYFYMLADGFDRRAGFSQTGIQEGASLFGFGQASGVDLPNESAGLLLTPQLKEQLVAANPGVYLDEPWRTGDTINVAIGQGGVEATPLQIANAFATFANGGTRYAPSVAAAVLDPVTGAPIRTFEPRVQERVYLPDRFRQPIFDGLLGVATTPDTLDQQGGTAFEAFEGFPLDQFSVAGKTGTSEKLDTDGTKLADFALFAAFAPAYDPQYAVAVVMEEAGFGGEVAAPVIRQIFQQIVDDTLPDPRTVEEIEADRIAAGDDDGTDEAALGQGGG